MTYVTFKRFDNYILANNLAELLKSHGIPTELEDNTLSFKDVQIFGNDQPDFRVKIKKEDFDKANQIQLERVRKELDGLPKDYYLYEFSDSELMEVIIHKDEWNALDFVLAQKLLQERGKSIQPEVLELLDKQRLAELTKTETGTKKWILAGYLFAILGAPLGMLLGLHIMSHKKTLPNGESIFAFNSKDRIQGKSIFWVGLLFMIMYGITTFLYYTQV